MSTYTPIASITLASAASSVTFSGIPQTYTDLVLVVQARTNKTADEYNALQLRFNSDSNTNYSFTGILGSGANATSERASNQTSLRISRLDNNFNSNTSMGTTIAHIQNYSNTTTNKTVISRGSQVIEFYEVSAYASLWRSTSAITSITLLPDTADSFVTGTTFNLYGVANASITNVAKATGGDSVYTDGTYWYHIFRSSGTFTPTQALTADYLVVAGGGAGGSEMGGGGGAGGMRCTVTATGGGGSLESALSLTAQAYTVTIGAGGTAAASNRGGAGSNSVFSTITATGGGGGGGGGNTANNTGGTGGSGGGGGYTGSNSAGGAGTSNQGYAGGAAPASSQGSGGGGGAGATGSNGSATWNGGNGGNGVATSISGTSTTYAGGGGGGAYTATAGTGGTGGGGAGSNSDTVAATAGTANTGGGGGGRGSLNGSWAAGAHGGSGIVIVRYAA